MTRRKSKVPVTTTEKSEPVQRGAVAVIDALGFKGIWKRGHANVVRALRKNKSVAESGRDLYNAIDELMERGSTRHVSVFSDSMIVAAVPRAGESVTTALNHVVSAVAELTLIAAAAEPPDVPLLFRGCIAVGDLTADADFVVGEPVDEAAFWHQRADAAIVWLTPGAAELVNSDAAPFLFEWDVPLKTSSPLRTLVVNPIAAQGEPPNILRLDIVGPKMLAVFDAPGTKRPSSIDVEIKKRHTAAFLDVALSQAEEWRKGYHARQVAHLNVPRNSEE